MHPKELDRSAKRAVEPPGTAPGGSSELDPPRIEQIEGVMEHAAEATLRAAFDRFFDAWFDRVYAFAWRLGPDTSYAETLTTLIFMKALHLLPRGSTGARELSHRLASERPRSPDADPTAAGPDRAPVAARRKGRTR